MILREDDGTFGHRPPSIILLTITKVEERLEL